MKACCDIRPVGSVSSCENCGRAGESKLRPEYGHDVRECGNCHSLAVPVGEKFDPEPLYSQDYFFGGEYANYDLHERSNLKNFRAVLDRTFRVGALPEHARVLEIGAATGAFYRALVGHPHIAECSYLGVEVSEYARGVAHQSGIEMLAPQDAQLSARVSALKPNLVVALAVWEHVARPVEILDSVINLCGPDVTIIMSTVDSSAPLARWKGPKWHQYHPPTHLNYPTRAALRYFLEDRGFEVRHHGFIGSYRPLVEYTRALGVKTDFVSSRRIMSTPIYFNTYDAQFIVGMRGTSV